jgi:hypothetical protein
MSKVHDDIGPRLAEWIRAQPMFFVGTAPLSGDGLINLSPKGLDGTLAVLGPRRVAYLEFTGSGVETIAHLRENGRIVVMLCAFEGPPQIVRLHGHGRVHPPDSSEFATLRPEFRNPRTAGVRSIIEVEVDRVSDSCGFAVPRMTFGGQRDLLDQWSERKSTDEIADYQATRNAASIDGLPGLPSSSR